jgi:hypothetical protein
MAGSLVASAGALSLAACAGNSAGSMQSMLPSERLAATSPSGPFAISVTTLKDAGPGSLRAAIQAIDARPPGPPTTIRFAVNGTIVLKTSLPAITNAVNINGATAPTYAGKGPVVGINANRRGGLVFAPGSRTSQLAAIAIGNALGNGVTLNTGSIVLSQNYIGLTTAGAALGNGGDGVYVSSQSTYDKIGTNPGGAAGFTSNVISANKGNGISLHGSSANTIVANRIGTDPTGATAIGNGKSGILLTDGSKANEIGGTDFVDKATGQVNNPTGNKGTVTPVFVVPPLGNQISGNKNQGISIEDGSDSNNLNGNFIGTTADGNAAIPNGGDGVQVVSSNATAITGCKFVNNPFVYYNVISGNGGNGLHITSANNSIVQGNFFGAGANNTNLVGNKLDGIRVDGSSRNTQVGGVIPLGNVSVANGKNGIEVADKASGFITFNTFGGLFAFKGAAPNGNDGILVTATGGSQTLRTNVFSGNKNNGIELAGNASGVYVNPNIVGLTTKGNAILSNGANGLLITGNAHGNYIGGYVASVIPQNTFSGNTGYGVAITGKATDNQIFSSFVGLNVAGDAAIANGKGGIYVGGSATHNLIGGNPGNTSKPRKNIISGNTGNGVTLDSGTSYISVIGNWIGLSRVGKSVPNTGDPIVVKAGSDHDTIARNVTKPR